MKKNFKKNALRVLSATLLTATLFTNVAFAGQWTQENSTWKYQNDSGANVTGWNWIDGKCYYFENNGNMLANTTTPDGYTVNIDGAWVVNGVIQTQKGVTAATTDTEYPLSHLKDWFAVNKNGQLCWKWGMNYLWELYPHLDSESEYNYEFNHTGTREMLMQQALATGSTIYFTTPTTQELMVLARLAGVNPVGYEDYLTMNSAQVNALESATREFLNSFDWRNATDYEKAVKISEKINKADYQTDVDANNITTYGCLVNRLANCNGYTSAASFLALCTDTQSEIVVVGNHAYPVYFVNGIWLSHEPTQKSTSFSVADYTDAMYGPQKEYYLPFAEYCVRSGYKNPSEDQVVQAFPGKVSGFGGRLTISFR